MSLGLSSGRATDSVAVPQGAGRRRSRWWAARIAVERALTGWAARCVALVAAYVAVGYAVSAALGLRLRWPAEELVVQAKWLFFLVYAWLSLRWLLASAGQKRPLRERCRQMLVSPAFFLELVVATAAVLATLAVFANLRRDVPAINETLYDSPLWRLDALLHLGVEPAVVATELAAEHGLLPWLDRAFGLVYSAELAVPLLFLVSARLRPLRGRLFFALCLLWMIGGVLCLVWPALGPAFYRPSRFVWLDQAPYAQYLQDVAMRGYVRFRTHPGSDAAAVVALHQGVAALPNLQVGVLALCAIASQRWRALSLALWLVALVGFVASLALGWHYAVDGYAGALLACVTWLVACRAVPLQRPDRDAAAPTLPRGAAIA